MNTKFFKNIQFKKCNEEDYMASAVATVTPIFSIKVIWEKESFIASLASKSYSRVLEKILFNKITKENTVDRKHSNM